MDKRQEIARCTPCRICRSLAISAVLVSTVEMVRGPVYKITCPNDQRLNHGHQERFVVFLAPGTRDPASVAWALAHDFMKGQCPEPWCGNPLDESRADLKVVDNDNVINATPCRNDPSHWTDRSVYWITDSTQVPDQVPASFLAVPPAAGER